jgi:hypothetical protein
MMISLCGFISAAGIWISDETVRLATRRNIPAACNKGSTPRRLTPRLQAQMSFSNLPGFPRHQQQSSPSRGAHRIRHRRFGTSQRPGASAVCRTIHP